MPLWEKVLVDLQPFHWLIVEAFLDPVVILIGLFVGWKADQAGKLIIAGSAGSKAVMNLAARTRFSALLRVLAGV